MVGVNTTICNSRVITIKITSSSVGVTASGYVSRDISIRVDTITNCNSTMTTTINTSSTGVYSTTHCTRLVGLGSPIAR